MQTQLKANNYLLYLYAFFNHLHFFGSLCVPFYLNRLGISYALMFAVETVFSICIFLFEIPTGIIADKFGRKISLFLGTIFFGTSFLISGITLNIGIFIIGQIIGAIGLSLVSGADKALIYENAKYQNKTPQEISAIASKFDGFCTVGMLIAFPVGSIFVSSGILEYTKSLGFVFISTAIAMFIASIFIIFIKEPKNILSKNETSIENINEENSTEDKNFKQKKLILENAKGCLFAFRNPELRKLSLDYSVISVVSRPKILTLLDEYRAGTHVNLDICKIGTCQKVEVEADRVVPINMDGEISYSNKATFEIVKKGIKLVLPKTISSVWLEKAGQEKVCF